jgi:hypothetical protein
MLFLVVVNLGNLQREQKKHNSFHVIGRGLSCFIYVSQGFPRAHNSMERHTVPRFVHLKTGSGRNWRTENLIKMLKTKYLLLCASLLFTSTVFTACDDDDDSSSSTEKLLKSTTETDYEVNDGEIGASNTFIVESYVYDSKGRVIGFTVNDSDYNYKCVISYNGNHVKMIKTDQINGKTTTEIDTSGLLNEEGNIIRYTTEETDEAWNLRIQFSILMKMDF